MLDASVVKTKKLYYEDAYRTEFEATVLSAETVNRDGFGPLLDVVLDQTCFFPEEGGQSPDRGELGGLEVVDVQIRDGEIHHYLRANGDVQAGEDPASSAIAQTKEGPAPDPVIPLPSSVIRGRISWPERFSNMQQHSGEHLFSGTVHRKYGFDNVGFHLSAREVTLDFSGVIPAADLPELEREVNAAIWSNIPSEVRMTDRAGREGLEYRSKLDLDGEVRIVTFPGVDSCACCAPHVRRTGEIGLLKVVSMISWKGGVRVSIVCGDRALRTMQEEHRILTETALFLTTSKDSLLSQVQKLKNDAASLASELKSAAFRELQREAEAIPESSEHAVLFSKSADTDAARKVVNELTAVHSGYSAVFTGGDGGMYQFIIGSRQRDCREICAVLKETFGARGGGKPDMVQGSVSASPEEILEIIDRI